MAPFVLSRATARDMHDIVQVQYRAFDTNLVRRLFMGCTSRDDLPNLAEQYAKNMAAEPADVWIKVDDPITGRLAAASNWKVYLGSASAQARERDVAMPWLDDATAAEANTALHAMNTARVASNTSPFLHLHILFTSPEYRRRGIASMMMRWGCDLADLLFLPAWIEASPEGNFLYKNFGFHDQQQLSHNGDIFGTCMRRDARSNAGVVASSVPKPGGIDFGVL